MKHKLSVTIELSNSWKAELNTPARVAEAVALNLEFLGEVYVEADLYPENQIEK